ncbi:MAG: heme-degrading domain-containing protein [Acidobacteriaceae bacterium]
MLLSINDDLAKLAVQEQALVLSHFDNDVAWRIGTTLRDLSLQRKFAVAIDVRRFGYPLFYCALEGTSPANSDWVRRKGNVVAHFLRSSYAVGLDLRQKKTDLPEKHGLPFSDYAAHGGSFPIHVEHAGFIGSVTVSGLPQRDDHELVVEALCLETRRDYASLRLPPQDW